MLLQHVEVSESWLQNIVLHNLRQQSERCLTCFGHRLILVIGGRLNFAVQIDMLQSLQEQFRNLLPVIPSHNRFVRCLLGSPVVSACNILIEDCGPDLDGRLRTAALVTSQLDEALRHHVEVLQVLLHVLVVITDDDQQGLQRPGADVCVLNL